MKKTVHYRRAVWPDNTWQTLGRVVTERFLYIDPNVIPIFDIDDNMKCMIAKRHLKNNKLYIHFVCYEQGAPVAVINTQVNSSIAEAGEQEPEGTKEYILSQLFCLIYDNNIVWTTHNDNLRESKIQQILALFLVAYGAHHNDTIFGFQVVLDQTVVQRAFNEGIQEIDLGIGAFAPTLDRVSNNGDLPDDGLLTKLSGLLRKPATAQQLEAAADIEAKLVLRPGRDWDKPDVKALMITMSNNIRHTYDDEFVIITKSGLRLTRDKMSLKKDCEVQGTRRILESLQMETQMRIILNDLISSRMIDE